MNVTEIARPNLAHDSVHKAAHQALARQDYATALQVVRPFVHQTPLNAAYLDIAITAYWHLGDAVTAMSLLRILIGLVPDDRAVWGKLGAMLLAMGEKQGAEAAFEHALQLAPRSIAALGALNMIRRFDKGSHRARLLREIAQNRKASAFDRAVAWNACGKIDEAAGDFAQAFRSFDKSNKAQPARYPAKSIAGHVAAQQALYQPRDPGPADGPTCIFVVGLPRSGTTLVDAILSRHPLVRSTGEGAQLQSVLDALRRQFPGQGGSWDWMAEVGADDLARARAAFHRLIATPKELERPFVVNKLPLGAFDMGFAQMLLPEAKFVFMSRHPLDVGLSNFVAHFHDHMPFAKSLDGIAHMTRQVYLSLDDYLPKLGDALRVQSYHALVTDPDSQIRGLLAHVGLPWDDVCLTPEAGMGAVRTASVMQVREGINTKGLDKWQRYAPQLAPLTDALGAAWMADWHSRDADWARRGGSGAT